METSRMARRWRGFLTADLDQDLAIGRTSVPVRFKGTWQRVDSQFLFAGEAIFEWNDRYDFELDQPGGAGAHSLQIHRGAKEFRFGAVSWRQRVEGSAPVTASGAGPLKLNFRDG